MRAPIGTGPRLLLSRKGDDGFFRLIILASDTHFVRYVRATTTTERANGKMSGKMGHGVGARQWRQLSPWMDGSASSRLYSA